MDFQTAVKTCLQKYVDFTGRARRSEYWWFALFSVALSVIASFVLGDWVGMLVNLALLLPSLAAGTRRLHDMGKSGWFQLVWIIPFIGWLVMIYWLVQPSVVGDNQYGPASTETAPVAEMPPGAV
jgi:uncharacterized membrane protein YhaH (DUF805 family)